MPFELPELPYGMDDLAPVISGETLDYHHGRHHRKYVDTLNDLVAGTPWQEKSLVEIIRTADGGIFNNGAQVWNHTFYWSCLSPSGGGDPAGTLADALARAFGSVDGFRTAFTQKALGQFGSGWAWLVADPAGNLKVTSTGNAGNPLRDDDRPLLTCDVWEHAYYIDYRNARPDYVKGFWKLVNWEFVAAQLPA